MKPTIPTQLENARIFPLTKLSKIPRVKWGNDTIYELNDSDTGYGIDTGRSKLLVVDCDRKHEGIDGIANFFEIAREHGGVPETYSVETPNGFGIHFYFRLPEGLKIPTSAGTIAKGVDIRANGGYVVGPNSTITKEDGAEGQYIPEDEDSEILMAPDWLLKIVTNNRAKTPKKIIAKAKEKEAFSQKKSKDSSNKEIEYRNALNWAITKMEESVKGERETTLNRISYFMGCVRVPKHEARQVVDTAINRGLSEREASFKFEHGYEDGLNSEELDFEQIPKQYNRDAGIDPKSDPLDTGFYSHTALSHKFAQAYPGRFLFWTENLTWYEYQEGQGHWKITPEQTVVNLMDKFLDELVVEIREKYPRVSSQVFRMQEKLWVKSYIEAAAALCRNRFINTEKELFDRNPYLINVKNGTLNLETGALEEHNPENYVTQFINVKYNPAAKDENFEKVISSIHPNEREYLQLFAGQSLLGFQPNSQVALFLHGRGSNGKTTFLDLLAKTSGSYGKLQPPGVLLSEKNGGDKFALADFEGLRTIIVEELPNAKVLDTGALKRIVGTSQINSRRMYKDYRVFENQTTIFVSCNRLPMINETDDGTWRRVLVVSFPYSYKKSKSLVKGEWDRLGDPMVLHAAQRKASTAEAFLAWRIEGALRWINEQRAEYDIPERISKNTEEWNENNDLMLSWFKAKLEHNQDTINTYIIFDDLWNSYNEFIVSRGNSPISMRLFSELFTNHKIYHDNSLTYKKSAHVLKWLKRSANKSDNPNYAPGPDKSRVTHIIGLRFKD